MTASRIDRLSVAAVLRESAVAFRANAGLLLVAAAIVALPVAAVALVGDALIEADDDARALVGAVVALVALAITGTVGEVFFAGVAFAVVVMRRTGALRDLIEIGRHLPYLRLLAVDVIFTISVTVGLVLLIVPGVLAFGWFALGAPVAELEGHGVRASLRRSRGLVRGSFWQVVAVLAPALVISDALAWLIEAGTTAIAGHGMVAEWLGSAIGEALTAPLFAVPVAVIAHLLIFGRDGGDQKPGRSSSRAAAS